MKKLLFVCLLLASVSGFAQTKWDFRVGVLTSIPVNIQQTVSVDLGSSLAEVGYKTSDKLSLTLTSGYLRFKGSDNYADFTNIPAMIGARYNASKNVYFGVSAGAAFFNDAYNEDTKVIYSPYIGLKTGHISVDMRYFNWFEFENGNNNLSLCVSYTL